MRLDEPITFKQAAKAIGWKRGGVHASARRLRRLAMRREREKGLRFVLRDQRGRPWLITLGAITRHLPELRPSRVDTLAESLRPVLEQVERRAREIVAEKIEKHVEPELQRLHDRDEQIASEVANIGKAIAGMTGLKTAKPFGSKVRTAVNQR